MNYAWLVQTLVWSFALWSLLLPFLRVPQPYTQLIAGSCAFLGQSKVFDLRGILTLSGLFFLVSGLNMVISRIKQEDWEEHKGLFLYLSVPALLFFSLFFFRQEADFFWLYLSAELFLLFNVLLYWQKRYAPLSDKVCLSGWLLFFLLLHASFLLAGVLQPLLSLFILAVGLLFAFLARKKLLWKRELLNFSLILAQLPLPLFFLGLFSPYWDAWGTKVGCLTFGLIFLTWAQLFFLGRGKGEALPVSSLALAAFLFFLKQTAFPDGLADDYHWGEFLLPWSNSLRYGLLPFIDFVPARGLINYVPGLFSQIFYDGSARSYLAAWPIMQLAYLLSGFYGFRYILGQGTAFLIFLFYPLANGVMEIEILNVLLLFGLYRLAERLDYFRWLLLVLTVAPLAVLFAPGQGCMLTLALFPAAVYGFLRCERRKLLLGRLLLVLALLAAGFFICSVPYRMLWGAVQYVASQGEINAQAHGLPWSLSWEKPDCLFEMLRLSWLGVLLALFIRFWDFFKAKRSWLLLSGFMLLLFFYAPRSLGRLDPGTLSRTGWTSYWAVCFVIPLIWRSKGRLCFVVLAAFLAVQSVYTGCVMQSWPKAKEVLSRPAYAVTRVPQEVFSPEQKERLQKIERVLEAALEDDETYLDLTNRGAQYFYLQRRMLTESVPYTMPHIGQQLHSLERLKEKRPPLVLLAADNILHDGGPLALRCHLLYRFVVLEGYVPFTYQGLTFAVLPERLDRVKSLAELSGDRTLLLKETIGAEDLGLLPVSWGRSFAALAENSLALAAGIELKGEKYIFSPLAGTEAGILAADYSGGETEAVITGYDAFGRPIAHLSTVLRAGKILVPLDADPGWLLSRHIAALSVRAGDKAVVLQNAGLYQRKEVKVEK